MKHKKPKRKVKAHVKKAELYLCNPSLNTSCDKTFCHTKGGQCYMTIHKAFAKDAQEILNDLKGLKTDD